MAGLVGLALASCDRVDESLGVLQKNEAPVVVPAKGVALQSLYAATGNVIDLQDFETQFVIPLINIELAPQFSASSTVTGEVEIAKTSDFSDAVTINLATVEAAGRNATLAEAAGGGDTRSLVSQVRLSDWEDAFVSLYGLDPNPRVNYLRYKLWLSDNDEMLILYNENGEEWFDAMEFTVTPLDSKLDVAPSYTLFYTVAGQQYSVDMYHNPDKHVYDDPVFNASVEVPEDEAGNVSVLEWWIAPTDNPDRTFGVMGEDPSASEGELAEMAEGAVKGQIDQAGAYKIEVNMLELTYTTKLAPASLYVMSTADITFAQAAQLGTEDYVTYEGMAGLLNKWGLTGQAAYKPTMFVNDPDVEVKVAENGTYSGGIMLDTSGAPLNANVAVAYPGKGAGLYYITANLQTMAYTGYQCSKIGVVGSLTNWGNPDDEGVVIPDIELKGSRTTKYMQWSGNVTLTAGDEWKIRANNAWVVDFGGANGGEYATDGSEVALSKGGANLVAAESGTFTVTVYFQRYLEDGKLVPYRMTVVPAN